MPRKVPLPGKKEIAQTDAVSAHVGTEWENALKPQPLVRLPRDWKESAPWDLSTADWESRLLERRSLVPNLQLFSQSTQLAVEIFGKLRLSDVPGTPTMAEACGEWFFDIVRALFGSLDPISRHRMIRELFLLVPKKNSKTTNGAMLMLTALLLNQRPRAPFIMTAPVQDVADLAFEAVAGAIQLDPVLSKILHIRAHVKKIEHRVTGADLSIMTFDPSVLTGQKVAGALIDELHVVAKMNKAPNALRQLRGGMVPFPEAFLAFITTQSDEAPTGIFKAELLKARAIRDGKRKGAMLPVLYEFPEKMQTSKTQEWKKPEYWPMVTPNAGRSVSINRLAEDFDVALATSEMELRSWASQHLNVEIGLALHSDRWAGAEHWEARAVPTFGLQDLLDACEVVDIGIDGGGLDDLLALAVVGRMKDSRKWMVWVHCWAHPSVLELRKSEAQRFHDFAAAGDLTLVMNIGEDMEELAALVKHVWDSGKLDHIGVDPHGLGSVVDDIAGAGVPEKYIASDGKETDLIIGISQGWKLNGAIKTMERRLAEPDGLIHAGQPIMNWCVGNCKIEPRGNAIIITKQASGRAKIDPVLAALDAVSLLSLNPQSPNSKPQLLML